jgi:hypothetical protein
MLAVVLLTILGTFWATPSLIIFGLFFFGTPLLAGALGCVARNLLDYLRRLPNQSPSATPVAAVLEMIAGLIAAVLFVIAQWASNPAVKGPCHRGGDGIAVLAREVSQQPREVAFHARPAG